MVGWAVPGKWSHLTLHRANRNLGIAAAQNIGIDIGLQGGADYILLSDQDSVPASNMVKELVDAAELLRQSVRLACVGPCYLDVRQKNPPPFLQIRGLRLIRQWGDGSGRPVQVDYLIASGCLIPVDALQIVGPMEDEIFIDYVDIEWGLRAKSRGLVSFGVFAAHMQHSLGDEPIKFMGKKYFTHSPLRHYYMVRNAIWLYRKKYIPMNWKFVDGSRLFLRVGFYSLVAPPRLLQVKMMAIGVWHALTSKMGIYSE